MDSIISNLLLAAMLCFVYTPIKQSMQMFQQNRYQIPRYIHWLLEETQIRKKAILTTLLCLMCSYGLLFIEHKETLKVLLVLLLFVYDMIFYRIEERKLYRKPLSYTNRIWRLLCATYFMYIMIGIGCIYAISTTLCLLMLPFLFFSPCIVIIFAAVCMQPIEKKIRMHYVKEASEILKQHPSLQIIGISGSYGKTSVKNIVYHLLSDNYYTLKTPHSFNNQMGITLTIRKHLQALHEVFVCEMGADHVDEIRDLMKFVKPRYSIVTAIGPQHLSTFHSMENIIHEKMQMIECLPKDGIGVINMDNSYIQNYNIKNTCQIIRYGTCKECDYRLKDVKYSKDGTSFDVVYKQKIYSFQTRLLGYHNVLNIVGSIAMAHTMFVGWDMLIENVKTLDYVEHRLELKTAGAYTILDDAYNSNPEGAKYALDVLKQMEGKRILVTPGFLDLGRQGKSAHIHYGQQIAQSADEVILVGSIQTSDIVSGLKMKSYPLSHIHVVESIHEAFALIKQMADRDSVVLLENDLPDAFNH